MPFSHETEQKKTKQNNKKAKKNKLEEPKQK
jgi:hypothetical protein